jgi:adenosine kinase
VLRRVGTRITTHGADGAVVETPDGAQVRVAAVPPLRIADPTGVGDAFRAGFLAAVGWGLPVERCAQVGATLATLVLETVGPQEYDLESAGFTDRIAQAYGDDAAAQVAPHLPAAVRR